jgi:hypothetical protein
LILFVAGQWGGAAAHALNYGGCAINNVILRVFAARYALPLEWRCDTL